jgi:hypothetical protein
MLSVGIVAGLLVGSTNVMQEEVSAKPVKPTLVVVVGAPGTDAYGTSFREWADRWVAAGQKGEANVVRIDGSDEKPSREILKQAIETTPHESPLWLVLIGHGTFDERTARFNLVGPDVSATELSEWIHKDQPTAIVNCASSSAPFINGLSGKNRIIVTATKSGSEQNYARFGQFIAEVIGDSSVDLDKDGQTSLLEAWLIAARRTQDFYSENGRLATEHALIDDNGDERGTRYDSFVGIRPVKTKEGQRLDGIRANQWHLVRGEFERTMPAKLLAERNDLELAVFKLRENRSEYREEAYYRELESLLVPLAVLYAEAERSAK